METIIRHGSSLVLPPVCACCLARAEGTATEWIQLGQGYRREFQVPECARCRSWKSWGLGLGILTLFLSGAAGLAAGAVWFPLGAMRLVPMLVAIPAGIAVFMLLRRAFHPKGHVPHCSPIAKADVDLRRGLTQDIRVRFANPRFAALWNEANP